MERLTGPEGISIRALRSEDVEAVAAIEREAFTTPWEPRTFAGLLDRSGVELVVMTDATDAVIGYSVLWCILDQGELANIAIAPGFRGRGLGARLLEHVLERARARGVRKVFLEVRASNEAAHALYARFGFEEVGRRRGYYERPQEDALVLVAAIEPAQPDDPAPHSGDTPTHRTERRRG